MKILFVLENYYPNIGGVETLFKTLVEELAKRGYEVIVLTTQLEKSHPKKEQNGTITILRYPFWNRYFFTFFAIFPIISIIRKCDFVHTTSYNAALPAFFAAKLFRKKVVVTFHEAWSDLWFRLPYMSFVGRRLHYLFEWFLLKLPFDRFIAVSESTAKSLRRAGVSDKRIVVNHNGIDYSEFETITSTKPNQKRFTYTFFGRLGASKGLDLLMDAAVILKERLPQSSLRMIIPKTPEHFFQEIYDNLKDKNLLHYIDLQHHLPFEVLKTTIQDSDCVIIPSYSEGFCYAAVETMALGVPIISSNQKALKEVVSGKFIKMREFSSAGIVEAVERAAAGDWEETPLKKFHLKDTIDRYLVIYNKLI